MPEYYSDTYERHNEQETPVRDKKNYILHIGLFILTFITCTFAGAQWISVKEGPYELSFLMRGLPYSISIMFIISCHEFGHYFAARWHRVKATLPYYIPFPPIPMFINFGTMGAVIRTKSPIYSKKAMFDIGIAGPLSGFVACLIVLVYGFTHLPGIDYLLAIHPDYFSPAYGQNELSLTFGNTLLFSFFKLIFVHGNQFFPPMSEIYHYPYLCVGWFGLFVTAMNMIPIGQLDGGHISYTVFGEKKHYNLAVFCIMILTALGMTGLIEATPSIIAAYKWYGVLIWSVPAYFIFRVITEFRESRYALIMFIITIAALIVIAAVEWTLKISTSYGWLGWFIWAMLLFFIIKLKHPAIPDERELDPGRKALAYLSFFILIISFSPTPFLASM